MKVAGFSLLGLLSLGLFGCKEPDHVTLVGMAETREIMIASKLSGRLALVAVSEGDTVHEGQVVATMASPEVEAKVEQARGAVRSAEARLSMMRKGVRPEEIRMAETALSQAGEARKLAETTWGRVSKLLADSAIPTQQADEAQFKWRSAQENEYAAQARLDMMKNGARTEELEAAEGALQSARNALLEALSWSKEATISSPADGIVQKRYLGAGEIAPAGAPILVLIRPSELWVALPAREDQLAGFRVGDTIHAEIPALGKSNVAFRVTWLASMGDYATWKSTSRRGDADLRSFEIRLVPVNPEPGLLPGMTVRFQIPAPQDKE